MHTSECIPNDAGRSRRASQARAKATGMTIHTKWMELLRSEATDAFEYGAFSTRVEASFIDGQIKLMKSEATQTWCVQLLCECVCVEPDFQHTGPISSTPSLRRSS